MYEELIQGAYDLHVHCGPDVMPRKMDDLEMAERLLKSGMKGIALKSHYFCTADRAKLVNKLYPGVNLVGTITFNNAVGGLNPVAMEMAARAGAKLVWMPTCDATNEQAFLKNSKHEKLPYWAKLQMELIEKGITTSSISLLEEGKLKKEVYDILDTIAKYNIILTTGHIGKEETFALVKEAVNRNVKKIIVTHPDFPSTYYTKEEQKELTDLGAYMEHCFTTPYTNKTTWENVFEQIRYVGPEHCIIATDLGQPVNPYPDEGMLMFAAKCIENGFSEEEVKRMTIINPTQLVEG
jgi:hypothetical protein